LICPEAAPESSLPGARKARPAWTQAACRGQPSRWSLTRPQACRKDCTVVGPTKAKPSFLSALESAWLSGVTGGTSRSRRCRFTLGAPPTAPQASSARLPPSARRATSAWALFTAPSILPRWRTMPASESRRATSRAPKRATRSQSKPSKARRKASRFPRMVRQESPAWNPSSTSISNRWRSSALGTPHSSSW
jgi:hypothetical protein